MTDRSLVVAVILFGVLAATTLLIPVTGLPGIFGLLMLGAAALLAGHRLGRRHP